MSRLYLLSLSNIEFWSWSFEWFNIWFFTKYVFIWK